MSALFEISPAALAESRGKGVYLTPIVLALHIVLILFRWVGDLHITLNLLLSGDSYKSTQ